MSELRLIEQLKRHEGYRRYPYEDTEGVLTVGYGRNLIDNGISPEEAEAMLKNDIRTAEAELYQAFSTAKELSKVRREVLINMVFNLGISRFMRFKKMLDAIILQNYSKAAEEMLDSKWARQVGARATELARQMRTGVF